MKDMKDMKDMKYIRYQRYQDINYNILECMINSLHNNNKSRY